MIQIDRQRTPRDLLPAIERLFSVSADKIRAIETSWRAEDGAPVFTVQGRYAARGWTDSLMSGESATRGMVTRTS